MTHFLIHAIHQKKMLLCKDHSGSAIIEFAAMLPIFLLLAFGIMEYGMWFYESEITSASVNNITQAIQNNPNITATQLQQMVNVANDGLTRLSFTNGSNYICVKSYPNTNAAKAGCKKGDLTAANPNASGNPYAVAIDAYVAPNALTPLGNFVHAITPTKMGITQNTVATVGNLLPQKPCISTATAWGVLQYNPTASPQYSCFYIPFPSVPKCDGPGQVLQFSGGVNGTYSCATVTPPPNCNKPWQNLEWDSATAKWNCPNIPYVFAGGIAHAATTNPSAFWAQTGKPVTHDSTSTAWETAAYPGLPLNRNAICTPITFTVPAGLPPGQIIAQGNLIYPGAGNDGRWHGWTVSFVRLDVGSGPPTASSYNGSAYLCMDHGGNWTPPNSSFMVDSERQSWTITFIPN